MRFRAAALALTIASGFALAAASGAAANGYKCRKCPPPKKYDSTQVVRKSKTVDHSRVINTHEVVYRRSKVRYVTVMAPPPTVVNFVTQRYRITYRPHPNSEIRIVHPQRPRCKYGVSRRGTCVLRVRG